MRMVRLPRIRTLSIRCPTLPIICSVRGRIIVGFSLLVIILIAGAAGSIWLTRQHQSHLAEMEEHAITTSLLQDAKLSGSLTLTALQRYLLTGDETTIPEIRAYLATSVDSLTEALAMEETRGDEEEIAGFIELTAVAAFLSETSEQVIALQQSGDLQGATAALEAALPRLQQVGLEIDRATEFERQEVAALSSRADTTGDLVFWFTVIAGGGGAALGLMASVLIARSILKPLRSLESTALAVAGGDLDARATVSGPRELANLAASLNQMTDSLLDASQRREMIQKLRESEQRFRSALDSMIEGCVIVDFDWRYLYLNDALRRRPHRLQEEPLGRTMMEVYPHLEESKLFPYLRRCMEERIPHRMEAELTLPYDTKRWFDISIQPVPEGVFILSVDISERKQAEEALRESEERWRSLVENAPSFITTIDRDGTVLSINRTLPGLTPEQMIGTSIYDYAQPQYREQARECYERVFRTGETESLEIAGVRGDSGPFWYVSQVGPIRHDGQIVALVSITTDITELKRAEQALERLNEELEKESQEIEAFNRSLEEKVRERTEELRLSNEELRQRNREILDARAQAATDSLTGISNHRTFHERIRDEVSRAENNGATVGLIMLDIDGFKAVNDSRGHLAGDEILRRLASTLDDVVGRERAYRYGGDEFAVLLPQADRRKTARIAERLRRAAESRLDGDGNVITLSLGVASFPEAAGSAEELIYGADAAMYWAKSAGKNRVGDWADLVKRNGDGSDALYISDRNIKTIDTVGALVAALAAKDPLTGAHVKRCSWYALMLAEELGLSEKETSTVRIASLLHDIGKIAVPDEVLNKPGPLNEEEWAQMKEHPAAALRVLSQIIAIAEATPAILHHHEHFDGSGYPHGLAGEDIPIVARILLVTDAFDAMTTDRPYRKAMSIEAAIDELKSDSGSQFDPTITEAFLKALSLRGAQPLGRAVPAQANAQAVGPRSGSTC